ncbi:MAG: GntP family permease [Thermoguttaceae bacterium]|nr:GntP family permease [Thermoguttaceae bacterium]
MSGFFNDPIFVLALSLVVAIGSIIYLRIGAFLSLLLGALIVSFWTGMVGGGAFDPVGRFTAVCSALGTTVGKIGVLIVFGTIIGKCSADSGAADRIVFAFRRLFGEKRAPAALAGGAFVLSIPVFYDATFYLLLPLAKSAYRAVRKNYVLYLLAVGLGATISHTTIPPTPGPIAVAAELGVPLSTSLRVGLTVGLFLMPVVLVLAWFFNKVLPNPQIARDALEEGNDSSSDIKVGASLEGAPSLWFSALPIALPIALIALSSIADARFGEFKPSAGPSFSVWTSSFLSDPSAALARSSRMAISFLGNPCVALGLAAILSALPLLTSRKRRTTRSELEKKLNAALASAGSIILITAAGGAYGEMLRGSGIGERIKELFVVSEGAGGLTTLTLAFLTTALLKTAQGSSTTAMITSAGIFSAMGLTNEALGFNVAYIGSAIGVGSCVASWMNDSGFCVFSRSSGIAEVDCLKVWTAGTALLGLAGFVITVAASAFFPMI